GRDDRDHRDGQRHPALAYGDGGRRRHLDVPAQAHEKSPGRVIARGRMAAVFRTVILHRNATSVPQWWGRRAASGARQTRGRWYGAGFLHARVSSELPTT